jgi:hypothetical protein
MLIVTFMIPTAALSQTSPSPVSLGTSGNFVILSKTGISSTGTTNITGNIGISPAAASFITGFGLISDATNTFSTSSLITGKVYAADYATPTPTTLTTAVSDMETAYTDAAGRTSPDYSELYTGDVTGKILTAGVTISGSSSDVWIFQISGTLTVGNGAIVTLSGGANASNIFWQVADNTTLGTTSDFKGIILCKTLIEMQTGARLNGRALAQTAVTLDANAITSPTTVTSVENGFLLPKGFSLLQNYPNPFNPSTVIQYNIEKAAHVSLKIYNLLGLEVATLVNSQQEAGSYSITFNSRKLANNLSSGIYFYRLEAGSFTSTKKLTLMK